MKLLFNKVNKTIMHEVFYLYSLDEDYLEYDLINKEKMHQLILKRFKEDLSLLLELDNLQIIKEKAALIKQNGSFTLNHIEYDTYLKEGLFLVDNIKYKNNLYHLNMPKSIVSFLNNMDLNQEYVEKQLFRQCMFGMLEVYGVLTFEETKAIYEHIRPSALANESLFNLENHKFLKEEFLYAGYRIYEDGITHPLIDELNLDIDVYLPKHIYDIHTYISFYKIRYIDHIYDYYHDETYKSFKLKKSKENLNKTIQNTQIEKLEKEKTNLNWPLWTLGGASINHETINFNKTKITPKSKN